MLTNVFAKMTMSPLVRERRKCDLEDGGEYERGQTSVEKSGDKGGRAERELKERIVMKRARHDASKNERDHVRRRRQGLAHTLTLLCFVGGPLRTGSRSRGRTGVRK